MFKEEMESRVAEIEEIIRKYMPSASQECECGLCIEAMNYSIEAGGKRLRPMMMWESYKMFGGQGKEIEPFMAAMEMIHTFSLVHDDLPAMDNDEYRRGKLSTHAKYGHAMGILAGDALFNYAIETALKAYDIAPSSRIIDALKILTGKAGVSGMLGGQVVDVLSENKEIDMDTIRYIHENKTAAMIESSLMIGACLAGASKEDISVMEQIGSDVGLAFQIQDDILDETSTTEVLGKPVGSDARNGKTTYLTLVGFNQAQKDVKILSERALENLDRLSVHNDFLKELITSLIYRQK